MARQSDQLEAILRSIKKIREPEERAKTATEFLLALAAAERETKTLRQTAVAELVAHGSTYSMIGEIIGVNKSRIYQILNGMSGDSTRYSED